MHDQLSTMLTPYWPYFLFSSSNNIYQLIYMLNNLLPTQGRSQKASRSKLDFELPRIIRGEQASSFTTNSDSGPIALRFHWLTLPKDYSYTSLADIESQYSQLRRELLNLNEQAARNVQKLSLRTKPQRLDGSHVIEVRGREAQNNIAIIGRLRAQLEQLQKRVAVLGETDKDGLDQSIQQTREQITVLRHKNKEIQQKSKEIGCNIEAGDQAFAQLKKLEVQLQLAQRKRTKLDLRWKETAANLEKVGRGLQGLSGQAEQAETYIQQQLQSSRADEAERKLQWQYRQHSYNLQALKKNEDSVANVKQQKYHQCLKQLEQITARIVRTEAATIRATEKQLEQRGEIYELEQKLNEIITAKGTNETQKQEEEKENERSIEEAFKHTAKVTRTRIVNEETKSQSRSQYGRISYEQEPNKTKLLNLRLNKSVNRKIDKANNTIDILPAENARVIKKKANTDLKADKMNISHQIKSTTVRVNTAVQLQQENPKQNLATVELQQKIEDYSQEEQIEEEIQQSFLKEPKPTAKQEFEKTSQDVDRIFEGLAQQPSKPHPQKVEATNSHDEEEEEEDDADLRDFKKSIAAELTGPYSGMGSIQIALGEIENSIRQHESRSRLQKVKDDPIEEQEEPIEQLA